jgi:hypothetical protein
LVDGAFVSVDGVHHQLEHRVENLASLFRIAIGEQFHRTLAIGEEDGDLLGLSLQRALGREDLLGSVSGSVRPGASEVADWLGGERDTAGPAELLARRDESTAVRARSLEPSATVLAKARAGVVLSLEPGTGHAGGASKQPRR